MIKPLTEFIGTFFLVFVIGNVVITPGAGAAAPLAIGAILVAMVYAGGHVSGAHYNPAVTVAVWVRGRIKTEEVPPYWVAQIVAALIAGAVVGWLKYPPVVVSQPEVFVSASKAFVAEFLGTFALAYVVLNVATARATAGNAKYGLAIGFTVMGCAYALGGISGGAFNPAVAIGIVVMGIKPASSLLVYFPAQLAAGAAAAYTFRYLHPDDV